MALGWAMVGTGAHLRDRMAPAARRARDTRLVAVCSRQLARAQEYAREFGFETAYDDLSAALDDDRVDVVYLATPNHLHATQVIEAARAGKHVLVEKPMALTANDAEAMVEACREADVRLGVGFHMRHHPAHVEARRLVREGYLGDLIMLDVQWVRMNEAREGWWQDPKQVGAYVTMARGVHLMDLLGFLTGEQPVEAVALTDGQRADRPLEETIIATLRFPGDRFGRLTASRLFPDAENLLSMYGTGGRLQTVGTVGIDPHGSLTLFTSPETRSVTYAGQDLYQAEIEAFNEAVKERSDPAASGVDGLNVVRITEALLQSARTGRAVAIGAA